MSYRKLLLLILLVVSAGCTRAPEAASIAPLLPSQPPIVLQMTSVLQTQIAQGNATNQAAIATVTAMWTPNLASTPAPNAIVAMPTQPVTAMLEPMMVSIRNQANVRTCASTQCEPVLQLHANDIVLANGTTHGEAVNGGSSLWYQIEYQGRQLYIYSNLITSIVSTPMFSGLPVQPGQAVPATPAASCNLLALYAWFNTLTDAYIAIAATDSAVIQAGRTRFAQTPHPACADTAHTYMLEAFDAAVSAREARESGDFGAMASSLGRMNQAMDKFRTTLTDLASGVIPTLTLGFGS